MPTIFVIVAYLVLVVAPAFVAGVVKDGSPLKREWWT